MGDVDVRRLTVATDGSCLGNPGFGGWAWALSPSLWVAGAHPSTTNNLMELKAVHELLTVMPPGVRLCIQTDSKYVIGVFTEWLDAWVEKGWRTSAKKPVANRVGIEMIARLLTDRDVLWEHVRGHSGHRLNEVVDTHARAAAEAVKRGRPPAVGDVEAVRRDIQSWERGERR